MVKATAENSVKSGVIGVRYVCGKWQAVVSKGKVNHHIGRFDTIDEASDAREAFKSW
jgi:hypothetical protein